MNTTNEAVRAMGVRDGRYGLNRFAGVPNEYQSDYDAGYAEGERNPVDTTADEVS